ncbi:FHA domain-containing protein [Mycetocola zhujimingii]|uniref:FHA domain-containing protein n=1 Tax=Mycetocola zhujimingii TaxID=2079792 RepID=UPI000D354986|nr:FHA domain-containing protein [Mycetocola zhujimingii]AWB87204.1 hypothetical protein C3E77_11640 [Mycetocola zhujimingii]
MTNGSEFPDEWNGNPIPPRPPLPPVGVARASDGGIPAVPGVPAAPGAPASPVPAVPAVPMPGAGNADPRVSAESEPEPAKFKIGMPPGINFDPDTVPSSDFPAVVPVAKPGFGPAPTPQAPTPQAPAPGRNHERDASAAPSLVLPDGTVLPLAGGLVVGRDPLRQEGYPASVLARLHDVERSVSKTHAALGVSAGGAWVVDLNSTNGTFLVAQDGSLTPCLPEVPTPLLPGVDIRFGEYRVAVRLG